MGGIFPLIFCKVSRILAICLKVWRIDQVDEFDRPTASAKSDYDATLGAITRRGSKRRTMKKSVWGVATFAALALSLSACGADPAATEPEPATEAEGEEAPEIERSEERRVGKGGSGGRRTER